MSKFEVCRYSLCGKLLHRYRIRADNLIEACRLENHLLSNEQCEELRIRLKQNPDAPFTFHQSYDNGLPENKRQRVVIFLNEGEFI